MHPSAAGHPDFRSVARRDELAQGAQVRGEIQSGLIAKVERVRYAKAPHPSSRCACRALMDDRDDQFVRRPRSMRASGERSAATEFQRSELLSDSCRGISGVNRSELIDSPFELDRRPECVRLWRMSSASSYVQLLVLERRDPRANMARFYVLSLEPTLFGDMALVREWGRLGAQGRRRLDLFEAHAQASEALETWLTRKLRKGYRSRLGTAA